MKRRLCTSMLALPVAASAQWFDPELELVPVDTFDSPIAVTHAGDERLFITEKDGTIIVVQGDGARSTFLDIDTRVGSSGSEQGLFSVAFHPDYPGTPYFFVNYTNNSDNTVIARYEVTADPDVADFNSEVILLTINQDFANHNGGQLQFGPNDGFLYIGMGDGGSGGDPNCRAQNNDTLLGKMLRLDVDQNVNTPPYYGIPADNPFGGLGEPMDEVWAEGLRNPWRFSFDRLTHDLYIADVGQNDWEEVNFQAASSGGGENYGWKVMEGNSCFDPLPIDTDCSPTPPACFDAAYTDPFTEYDHGQGCSITGGYVYRGQNMPALQGWYVYGDYCSGTIWAAVNSGGWTVNELMNVGFGITSFGEDVDGELYLAQNNTVYRFESPVIFVDGLEAR